MDFAQISGWIFENIQTLFFPEELVSLDRKLPKMELISLLLVERRGETIMSSLAAYLNVSMSTATGIADRLGGDPAMRPVVDSANALAARADTLAVRFFQYKAKAAKWLFMNYPIQLNAKLVSLEGAVGGSDDAPTAQDIAVFQKLRGELDARLAEWHTMQQQEVAALNALIQQHGITPVYVGDER